MEDPEVRVWVPGDPIPPDFGTDEPWTLAAHNYRFEQAVWVNIMIQRYGFPPPSGYACTMAMAMANNLPASLAKLAQRLGIEEQKDTTVSRLMVRMSNKKTYNEYKEGSTAHKNHLENLALLIGYCQQDVRTEEAAYKVLKTMQFDHREFEIDRIINDRGIRVDTRTAQAIDKAVAAEVKSAGEMIAEITGGEVTSGRQVAKMLTWLRQRGFVGDSLARDVIKAAIADHEHFTALRKVGVVADDGETIVYFYHEPSPPEQMTSLDKMVYDRDTSFDRKPGNYTLVTSKMSMSEEAVDVLRLRQRLALGSVAKYDVMIRVADADARMHGLFQLYGASMTGRWAGRLVQFQNLPRMSLSDVEIDLLCRLFLDHRIDTIKMFGYDVIAVAKQLIRPMFTARDAEHQLIVSDLSQIECRVLAWLAGCPKLLDMFSSKDRDPYAEMASDIYKRPQEECGKGTDARQLGKTTILGCLGPRTPVMTEHRGNVSITQIRPDDRVWDGIEWVDHQGVIDQGIKGTMHLRGISITPDHEVLTEDAGWVEAGKLPGVDSLKLFYHRTYDLHNAGPRNRFTVITDDGPLVVHNCGYGMGKNKFQESAKSMAGLDITHAVASQAVDTYRGTFPEIPAFWKALERAVTYCLRPEGGIRQVGHVAVGRSHDSTTVAIRLPSGRCLFYPNTHRGSEGDIRFSTSKDVIGYTYGGKLTENVTQAVARDVLMESMDRFETAGLQIVGHVHDEVICEVPRGSVSLDVVDAMMTQRPEWAMTLPLAAETSFCDRYTK